MWIHDVQAVRRCILENTYNYMYAYTLQNIGYLGKRLPGPQAHPPAGTGLATAGARGRGSSDPPSLSTTIPRPSLAECFQSGPREQQAGRSRCGATASGTLLH